MSWDKETAHQRFWRCLLNNRLDSLLANKDELRSLRYDWKRFRYLKEKLKTVLKERGVSLTQRVAEAYGDSWGSDVDSEDEEKSSPDYQKSCSHEVKKIPNAVRVGPACKVGVCEGEVEGNDVQAGNDFREKQLQTQGLEGGTAVAQEKGGAEKKKPKVSDPDVGLEGAKPDPKKKKRVRKRPMLGGKFKNIN